MNDTNDAFTTWAEASGFGVYRVVESELLYKFSMWGYMQRAFIAGTEWQRERDASVVLQYYCGYDGVATKHGHHYVGAMENVAEHVRSGEGKDWKAINSTVGGHV